ncbi:MAG: copper amine oxidase N-terminal domain-containing protein [Peptococcaceae bacterium]|nr:copper amine oxidase N-terminal domain-containing protein [Peptococcaceae bacterium]
MKNLRWLAAAGLMALAFAAPQAGQAADGSVALNVNGATVASDASKGQAYINESGRTMIPLRVVGENLDYTTDWTPDGKIHISGKDGKVDVTLQVGSKEYTANGQAGQFATAPLVRDGRTYLPARDFTEIYGNIYWDGDMRTVFIYNKDEINYLPLRKNILRRDATGAHMLTMPEGYEMDSGYFVNYMNAYKILEDKGYVLITYHSIATPLEGTLFRDDGDHMTYVAKVNTSSDFTVMGGTLYHTMGVNAGLATSQIVPQRLYATSLDGKETTVNYTLDFAVNACKLTSADGNLVATDKDGVQHVVDLSTLVPDAE